ncbi:unnamed protein product [Parajaminaea phylloscopi]
MLDLHGDILSAKYGSPEQSKVPRFRRSGHGRLLGLSSAFRLESRESSSHGLVVSGYRSRSAYGTTSLDWQQLQRAGRHFVGAADHRPPPSGEDFIALEFNHSDSELSVEDQGVDEATDGGSGSDDVARRPPSQLNRLLERTSAKTRTSPADVAAWLTLADMQESLSEQASTAGNTSHGVGDGARNGSRSRDKRAVAEVQLAVLDKARRAHESNRDAVSLQLARLYLVGERHLWDREQLLREWQKMLTRLSSANSDASPQEKVQAWTQYIDWRMAESGFATCDLLEACATALTHLRTEEPKVASDPRPQASLRIQRALCRLLRSAGFPALATAIAQAQIELAYATHEFRQATWDHQMSVLRSFWESESPRVGEAQATGLSVWSRGDPDNVRVQSQKADTTYASSESSHFDRSLHLVCHAHDAIDDAVARQTLLAHRRILPARSTDLPDLASGEGEVDPYSVIFFADIKPFMIPSLEPIDMLPAILDLIDAPCSSPQQSTVGHLALASDEAFWPASLTLQHDADELDDTAISSNKVTDTAQAKITHTTSNASSQRIVWSGVTESLADHLWPPYKGPAFHWNISSPKSVAVNLLQSLNSIAPSKETRLWHLKAVELVQGRESATKHAKDLLAEQDEEWCFWKVYASLQRSMGKLQSARKVYKACTTAAGIPESDLPQVWLHWAELEIESDDLDAAVSVLVRATRCNFGQDQDSEADEAGDALSTPAAMLKAKRCYAKWTTEKSAESVPIMICTVWLAYLSEPPDQCFASAINCLRGHLKRLDSNRSSDSKLQELYRFFGRLMQHHLDTTRPIYRPSEVRDVLLEAISRFPNDVNFLSLLALHEARFKIEGVVRRVIAERFMSPPMTQNQYREAGTLTRIFLPSSSATFDGRDSSRAERGPLTRRSPHSWSAWVTAIHLELWLNTHTVSVHHVRTLFERSLLDLTGSEVLARRSHLASLWSLYLSFELRVASSLHTIDRRNKRQRGKTVLANATEKAPYDDHAERESRRQLRAVVKALRRRAKGVYYRAISCVPWDRDLHLCAFESPFRYAFSQTELAEILSAMSNERDMRLFGKGSDLLPQGQDVQDYDHDEDEGNDAEAIV